MLEISFFLFYLFIYLFLVFLRIFFLENHDFSF